MYASPMINDRYRHCDLMTFLMKSKKQWLYTVDGRSLKHRCTDVQVGLQKLRNTDSSDFLNWLLDNIL